MFLVCLFFCLFLIDVSYTFGWVLCRCTYFLGSDGCVSSGINALESAANFRLAIKNQVPTSCFWKTETQQRNFRHYERRKIKNFTNTLMKFIELNRFYTCFVPESISSVIVLLKSIFTWVDFVWQCTGAKAKGRKRGQRSRPYHCVSCLQAVVTRLRLTAEKTWNVSVAFG